MYGVFINYCKKTSEVMWQKGSSFLSPLCKCEGEKMIALRARKRYYICVHLCPKISFILTESPQWVTSKGHSASELLEIMEIF